jgi:uncharacterized protein (UPF0147 family)
MANIQEVIETLSVIEGDNSVPRNVRVKIKSAIVLLEDSDDAALEVTFDKIIQELDDLSEDPNLPTYTRTQIWSIVSSLESR